MNFEELQNVWQSQDPDAKVTINADLLLKEVRRNQHHFRATVFWRDVREVGMAFLLTFYFLYSGVRHHDWTELSVGVGRLRCRRVYGAGSPASEQKTTRSK